jgi:hypothetical protein
MELTRVAKPAALLLTVAVLAGVIVHRAAASCALAACSACRR